VAVAEGTSTCGGIYIRVPDEWVQDCPSVPRGPFRWPAGSLSVALRSDIDGEHAHAFGEHLCEQLSIAFS
jgi:hypothetical protein